MSTKQRPTESFSRVMRVVILCAKAVGADVSDPNFRIGVMTIMTMIAIIVYLIFTLYTLMQQFNAGQWLQILETACTMSCHFQGCTKFCFALLRRKQFAFARDLLESLYTEYEGKGIKYCRALNNCCGYIRNLIKTIGIFYAMMAVSMIALPVIILLITGKRYLIIHFNMPGIDVNTNFGYFFTLSLHAFCVTICAFGLFACDLYAMTFLAHSYMFVEIFKLKVEDFNELVATLKKENDNAITQALVDIVKWQQLYLHFNAEVNYAFSAIITVQVSTSGITIALTIIVILTSDWPSAYPFFLVAIYFLYLYCILGTKIEIYNDEFCTETYNISWYNLNVSQQKILQLVLMEMQRMKTMLVAGVLPLSVSTALQITKAIYSTTMMLIQFLAK